MAERLPRHIVDTRDFTREQLLDVFAQSSVMQDVARMGGNNLLQNRMFYFLFLAPSNLTQLTFSTAINSMGGSYDTQQPDSIWQGDLKTFAETMGYAGISALILRGKDAGDARRVSEGSVIPVISAGEVTTNEHTDFGQHPPQVMADLFTIYQSHGDLQGLNVVVCGDVNSHPVVNSLVIASSIFEGIHLVVTAPPVISNFDPLFETWLKEKEITIDRVPTTEEVFKDADVVYVARSRHSDTRVSIANAHNGGRFRLAETLDLLPPQAVILHDMMKGEKPDTATHEKSVWNTQVANNRYTKMALLSMMFEGG